MRLDRAITLNVVQPLRRLFKVQSSTFDVRRSRSKAQSSALCPTHYSTTPPLHQPVVPILMYHSISDDPEPGVSPYYQVNTSPAVFRQHMQFLADQGYRTITLTQLVANLTTDRTTPSLQHSITPPLHHSTTPPLHHSTTPPLHSVRAMWRAAVRRYGTSLQ